MEKTIAVIDSERNSWYLDYDAERGIIRISLDEKFKASRPSFGEAMEYIFTHLAVGKKYTITRF